MINPEQTELIGIPLILPYQEQIGDDLFSIERLARAEELDKAAVADIVRGGEPYAIGIAEYFRADWLVQLMHEGDRYAEASLTAAQYGVGQHEHLLAAAERETLRLPRMSNIDYEHHVEQVVLAGIEVIRRNNG